MIDRDRKDYPGYPIPYTKNQLDVLLDNAVENTQSAKNALVAWSKRAIENAQDCYDYDEADLNFIGRSVKAYAYKLNEWRMRLEELRELESAYLTWLRSRKEDRELNANV